MIVFKGGGLSSSGSRSGTGKGFGGLVAYLQNGHRASADPERVAWTSTRNLDDIEDPRTAAKVMRAHAEQNPRVARPVYHFGLSLAPGEHLSRDQWNGAVDRVLTRMGLDRHQALVIAHGDTDKEHVHVVVNRVGEDFHAWNARRDMVKANEVVHEIERELGLKRTGSRDHAAPELSTPAYQEARRTGQQPIADRVREEVGPELGRAASWRDFEERLAAHGFRLERAERGSGVVITDGQSKASLSAVDRTLSGPQLAKRFEETFQEHRERYPEPPQVAPPSGRTVEPPGGAGVEERAEALLARVSSTRATFTRADVERAAFYQAESAALVREALRPERVVDLGRDASGTRRFTTPEYFEAERRLFSTAEKLGERDTLRLGEVGVGRSIARWAPNLSEEQRAAVLHATTGSDFAQIVGRAGAGKTTAAQAIREAYRDEGYQVRGAALAGKAAEALERETGIPSCTLASLEHAWKAGRDRLHGNSVLVIDEAGMVDVRQLGRVLQHAQEQGAKVVLLGDPDQLKAIGVGDAYRGLLERYASANLETIRRQAEPWQRAASQDLARGRVAAALDAYEIAGRLHWTGTRAEAHTELVAHYLADRQGQPDPAQLIVTYRNDEARRLNDAVRTERQAAGELAPRGVQVGGAEYAGGDRLVFLKNDHQGRVVETLDRGAGAGVKNGTLGTIEKTDEHRFVVRLDDNRRVAFDPREYDSIAHGYAVTIHKAQGATVERVYVLADPMMNRNAAYVALTRHREGVHLYADRETFRDRTGLDRALCRESRKDLARDYAAADLGRLTSRIDTYHHRAQALRNAQGSLWRPQAIHKEAQDASRSLDLTRADVERFAAKVYARPTEAARAILADPRAAERLAAGQAGAYGELRGRTRLLLGDDAMRTAARQQVPNLSSVLGRHEKARQSAGRALDAVGRLGMSLADISHRLSQLGSAAHRLERASDEPEEALKEALYRLGHEATRAAVTLLPVPARLSIGLAIQALERALSRGNELGR